jgi:hypothetical protein
MFIRRSICIFGGLYVMREDIMTKKGSKCPRGKGRMEETE